MMNSGLNQGSARIYQFPARGRSALGGRHHEETRTADPASTYVGDSACSDSWYHQAAIEESKPVRDR
jgi:hypothetical protein